MLVNLTFLDILASGFLLAALIAINWYVDTGPRAAQSTSAVMRAERLNWMRAMARRENRILDGNLLSGLQNSAAFFASTALLALGGVLAMMGQADSLALVADALPVPHASNPETFRLRLFAPATLLGYAFFKFAWSQRLFGYCAVLIGATPDWDEARAEEIDAAAVRAGRLNGLAARSFTRGLRGLYFALGSLAWLVNPLALIVSTITVVLLILRREFRSESRAAILGK